MAHRNVGHFHASVYNGIEIKLVTLLVHQVHRTQEQSVINLYSAALSMRSVMFSRGNVASLLPTSATVLVDRCQFVGNERAVTLIGPFHSIVVRRSGFVANHAIHSGAGMVVIVSNLSLIHISEATRPY